MAEAGDDPKVFVVSKKHFLSGRNQEIPLIQAVLLDRNPTVFFELPQFSAQLRFAIGERMIDLF